MQSVFEPNGTNLSRDAAISPSGLPQVGRLYTVPQRCGVAVSLAPQQTLTVINPSGNQVCDFWVFSSDSLQEYLSMAHVHTSIGTIFPKPGHSLVSNYRRPLVTIIEDTSPGIHDTLIASCDHGRYQELGCTDYHDNCADNLRMALMAIGLRAPLVPAPFNLWMNVPVAEDGSTRFAPPVASPGDRMSFRTEARVIAVMSACPQDLTPVNGVGVLPGPLEFEVGR